ncbi:MAG: hypothetical protein WCI67_00050 [Chloroflexales bacterium]
MQVGQTITGMSGTYYLRKPLGTPGLYGQAFLCTSVQEKDFVVKAIRADAPSDARKRLDDEAQTLSAVAAAEDIAGVHYAVRLIDRSAGSEPEAFIVMERATGVNVLDDILADVGDWNSGGLDELLTLRIMRAFADALCHVHQAQRLYLDMKIDNLFWDDDSDELRIIDWNVVGDLRESSSGVAGDWARFGARLYEMRTGQRIGIDRDGTMIGNGPNGPRWDALPAGIRTIISRALALGYSSDEQILNDLNRELEHTRLGASWDRLLSISEIADGNNAPPIDVLAPLSRAATIVNTLPPSGARSDALAQISRLERHANERQGRVAEETLKSAFRLLSTGNVSVALSQFQRAYQVSGQNDPRPRRGIWIAQIAAANPQAYAGVAKDLEEAVELLNLPQPSLGDLNSSMRRLNIVAEDVGTAPTFNYLQSEVRLKHTHVEKGAAAALARKAEFVELCREYPDLEAYFTQIEEERRTAARRVTADAQHAKFTAELAASREQVRAITLQLSYGERIKRYEALCQLLHTVDDLEAIKECGDLQAMIDDLRPINELNEIIAEAQNVRTNDLQNLEAFYRRVSATNLAPIANQLVEYSRMKAWAQLSTAIKHQQSEVLSALQQQSSALSGFKTSVEQISTLSHRLRAIEESLANAGDALPSRSQPVDPSAQTHLLTFLYEVNTIRDQIEAGLLSNATERMRRVRSQYVGSQMPSDYEQRIERRKKAADLACQRFDAAMNPGTEIDFNAAIEAYREMLRLWVDNGQFYQKGEMIIERVVESLGVAVSIPYTSVNVKLFQERAENINLFFKEVNDASKRTIDYQGDQVVINSLRDDMSKALHVMTALSDAFLKGHLHEKQLAGFRNAHAYLKQFKNAPSQLLKMLDVLAKSFGPMGRIS